MKTLQDKARMLCLGYQQHRQRFGKAVAELRGLTAWGTNRLRAQGSKLLDEADRLYECVHQGALVTAEGGMTADQLRIHYRTFKKAHDALYELSKPWWRQLFEAVGFALVIAFFLRNFVFGLYHVPSESAETTILVGDRLWGNKLAYWVKDVKRGDMVIFEDPQFAFDKENKVHYFWQRYVGIPIPALGFGGGAQHWVKRVIAVPGDTIEGRVEDGKTAVYLNGRKLEEPYVNRLPLVHMKRRSGFLEYGALGPLPVPSFLRHTLHEVRRSYDERFPFTEQPFYSVAEADVVKNPLTGQPLLDQPFTPTLRDGQAGYADVFGPVVVPKGKYWVMGDNRKNSGDSRLWSFLDESLIHGRASVILYSLDSDESFWGFDLLKHPHDFWTKIVRWSRFGTLLKTTEIK